MNRIAGRHWSRFKQGFPSIIFLLAIQVWGGVYFNNFLNIEAPWSTIYAILKSTIEATLLICLFSYIDEFAPYIKLEFIGDSLSKRAFLSALITALFVGTIVAWHNNFYGASKFYFVFVFANGILLWALLYRAAYRSSQVVKN